MKRFLGIFSIFIILILNLQAASNSQWRGQNRDGIYQEKNLMKKWPAEGPKLLWSTEDIGKGYTTAIVASDRVYVTGMLESTGYLFTFDLNGKLLKKAAYGPEWDGSRPGTRSTPTVVGDHLYIMSGQGRAICMDAVQGKEVWSVDLAEQYGARNLRWGLTESPFVDGNRVIFTPGGEEVTVVALDRMSGKMVWKYAGNGEKSAYCSPGLFEHGGKRFIITMTGKSIIALNAETGEFVWSHPHTTRYDIHPNTPTYQEGALYCVSGYGTGGVKLKLSADGTSVQEVWRAPTLDSQMGASILLNGYIYGSGHNNKGWHCLDWKTGDVKYSSSELGGKGNIVYADGMLYCYSEKGGVGLVKPDPQAFTVVSSFKAPLGSDEHWAHMVIVDGRLYVRHGNALMVYSIAK